MNKRRTFSALLLALALASGQMAGAQTESPVHEAATGTRYIYCELVGIERPLSNKVTVSVDFGQERGWFEDMRLRDEETGRLQAFNSMVDALNYMGQNGWEFVQAYTANIGGQNVYHWLLRMKVE